jgi:adenylosuccinate lyase
MLERYTRPEMKVLWGEDTKFETWLSVELAVLAAKVELGLVSREAEEAIRKNAGFSVARINEIDAEIVHDMNAFLANIHEVLDAAGVGEYKERLHEKITSYDIEDPALILQLREATGLILAELRNLEEALRGQAEIHRNTLMIARTHGQYAEPAAFGGLLLGFAEEVSRDVDRIARIYHTDLAEGKLSGAVGTYAGIPHELEERALAILGLKPARAETQILQRDRHATLLNALAVASAGIERIARTFWVMMHSAVRELQEPRSAKQKGSSAMSHKRNPIGVEQQFGLPRLVRAYAHAAVEDIATLEWRDISQSSVERHILSGATSLTHYMAVRTTGIVKRLVVFPARMKDLLENDSLGVWASQQVRTALMESGVGYEDAYRCTQLAAFTATDQRIHYREVLRTEKVNKESDQRTVEEVLGTEKIEGCFDAATYLEDGLRHIFRKG